MTGLPEGVIAIDGKSVRRSGRKKNDTTPIHMVSAFAARQRLVLGQVKVADKSNEIVAIPRLLKLLAIEGAIVTIDAMGCQHGIGQTIRDQKADYVLALKGNQGSLRQDVALFATEQRTREFADTEVTRATTVDDDHGRIETRTMTVMHDVGWLHERHGWPGLKAVVMVESGREIDGKTERETRFYLTSLVIGAARIGPSVRNHWSIENSLHWVMDMTFRDDERRVRTEHAPANFTISNDSLRLRRKLATWDDDFLASLIAR